MGLPEGGRATASESKAVVFRLLPDTPSLTMAVCQMAPQKAKRKIRMGYGREKGGKNPERRKQQQKRCRMQREQPRWHSKDSDGGQDQVTALVASSVRSLRKGGSRNDSGGGDSTPLPFGRGWSHLDFRCFKYYYCLISARGHSQRILMLDGSEVHPK